MPDEEPTPGDTPIAPADDAPRFTQAQLDEQIRRRLDREKATRTKALREALGIDGDADPMESLAALVAERDELKTKVPPEKPAKAADDGRVRALEDRIAKQDAESKARITDLRKRFTDRLLDEAVRGLVATQGDRLSADGAVLLAPQIRARLQVDEETFAVVAVDQAGELALRDDGKPLPTGDVLTALMREFPSTVRAGGGGAGTHPSGPLVSDRVGAAIAQLEKTGSSVDAATAFGELNQAASKALSPTR